MARFLVLIGLVLTVVSGGTGCAQACPAALLTGVLTEEAGESVVIPDGGGPSERIVWPFGHSVGRDGDDVVVTNWFGQVVAQRVTESGSAEASEKVAFGSFAACLLWTNSREPLCVRRCGSGLAQALADYGSEPRDKRLDRSPVARSQNSAEFRTLSSSASKPDARIRYSPIHPPTITTARRRFDQDPASRPKATPTHNANKAIRAYIAGHSRARTNVPDNATCPPTA